MQGIFLKTFLILYLCVPEPHRGGNGDAVHPADVQGRGQERPAQNIGGLLFEVSVLRFSALISL